MAINKILVKRDGAVGDVLCASFLIPLIKQKTGLEVIYQANAATHCVLRRTYGVGKIEEPNGFVHVDLNNAYEHDPNRRTRHFTQMFLDSAFAQLRLNERPKAINFGPRMHLLPGDKEYALEQMSKFPKPWVGIIPRSNSHAHRTVPDHIWNEAAPHILGTKFWLGTHPAPVGGGIKDLGLRHLDNVIRVISELHLLISVDTGPMHLGAALGIPMVTIMQQSNPALHLSDQKDFIVIQPDGLQCIGCTLDFCPINRNTPPCQNIWSQKIIEAANNKLRYFAENGISCVVAIYKPTAAMLNRCLEHVENQVQEIIVVVDEGGTIPHGARTNWKIRYLRMPGANLGYGAKANYGARHSNYSFIYFSNDDLWIEDGVVAHLRSLMKDDVGIVTHTLRYPQTGLLQYAGKTRTPGHAAGFGHQFHNHKDCPIAEPVEQETACGASMLVRREAFYKADGFNQKYFAYCDDDDLALNIRRVGYKIMFSPHVTGWHEEHVSTFATPGMTEIMNASNKMFRDDWLNYLMHNIQRVPIGNFDYLK